MEPHQGNGPLDSPLGSKPQMHDPTRQNRVSGNLGELLLGIELTMSRSTLQLIPSLQPLSYALTS